MLRVKGSVKVLIISLVFVVVSTITVDPRFVADGPRLNDFPLGVNAPVHHETEFEVLPLVDAVGDNGVGFRELVGLGEGGYVEKAK